MPVKQPLAIVAAGVCFPFARNFQQLRALTKTPTPTPMSWRQSVIETDIGYQFRSVQFDYKKFGVPPLYRDAISTETKIALLAADDALKGAPLDRWGREGVDCFCGTSFGSDAVYRNAMKISLVKQYAATQDVSQNMIERFKQCVGQEFSSTSHDRVGEMASSIPARIAHFAGIHGKCMTLDALDVTGMRLLQAAHDSLLQEDSSACILTSVQRFNAPFLLRLLKQQGADTEASCFCEGAVSLIVRPLRDALADKDPILAELDLFDCQPDSSPLTSRSQFGFGLANQLFMLIAEQLATESVTSHQMTGSSLRRERWQLNFRCGDSDRGERASSRFSSHSWAAGPVAIVGYQAVAGGCFNNDAIWKTLVQGESHITEIPPSRLSKAAFFRAGTPLKLSSYSQQGASLGCLSQIDSMLPMAVMPVKRKQLDALHKLALIQVADILMEARVEGRCGVVVASNLALEQERALAVQDLWSSVSELSATLTPPVNLPENRFTFDGCSASGIARTISDTFKLSAECVAIEAACASSLAALHYGVRALQSGRLDTVICGGAECPANERDMVLCSAQMMLSKNKMAPFSQQADGFSPGDGGAFFILKRLADAKAAGDTVHGVILGVSGSCDAKSMTAPDLEGQVIAINKAQKQSGLDPAKVSFIEAHGTGTVLGDQTEISSISSCYGSVRDQPLTVGTVKYNFGHCFAGAGALGLNKILLSFKHQTLLPTPVHGALNEALAIDKTIRFLNIAQPWPEVDGACRYAALNSFGTGGLNYHLILQQGNL